MNRTFKKVVKGLAMSTLFWVTALSAGYFGYQIGNAYWVIARLVFS